ncbi:MAG: FAD-dependent oxidoreductase [Elusimicrobia bacterium]|nr:FAD-dependent oxidoreductase [Elusimicrobiota bacterium]
MRGHCYTLAAMEWEVIIVGGGPAGLAAGMHLARAGYRALLVERDRLGGQARGLGVVENYPGFPAGIDGGRLMDMWVRQARRWGLKTASGEVRSIKRSGSGFRVGRGLRACCVIYCPGAAFRTLGLPGEKRLRGRGVFHAAFEADFRWRGRAAAVVGGGEAAVHQALALARQTRRVSLVCRGGGLKAHRLLLRRLAFSRVTTILGARVAALEGKKRLKAVLLTGERGRLRLAVDALFVLIGKRGAVSPFPGRPPAGFFTAGDAQGGAFRQIAVASGSGIKAAMRAIAFLESR